MRTKPLLILLAVVIGGFSLWWFAFRNPLSRYGLSWTIQDSGGASGSYRWVVFTREWHGKRIHGPSVGGSYPSVRFADLDGDGIPDIIVEDAMGHSAQFALTFPTNDTDPLFRVIGHPSLEVGYPPLNMWAIGR
jgi:hypothetical protein